MVALKFENWSNVFITIKWSSLFKKIGHIHQWYNLILLANINISQKNMMIQNGLAFLTNYTILQIAYSSLRILVYAVNLY